MAANWAVHVREMFLRGFWGYTDDRLADGRGWDSFDVNAITCPVTVVHGGSDPIVPVAHGYYTAGIVPGATMRVVERFGHLGIISQVVDAISDLLVAVDTRSAVAAAL